MAQCWKCGGQMPAYAVRCGWCGRSTTVSAFFQVFSLAVVVVGGLVIVGVMPLSSITRHIPGLETRAGLPTVEADASPAPDQAAAAPRSAAAPSSERGAKPPSRRADDEEARRKAEAPSRRGVEAGPGTQALASGGNSCESAERVDALARQHADWSRADLELISCGNVAVGFSTEQVMASLGRPRSVNRPSGASQVEEWVYRGQRLVVERGAVVSIRH